MKISTLFLPESKVLNKITENLSPPSKWSYTAESACLCSPTLVVFLFYQCKTSLYPTNIETCICYRGYVKPGISRNPWSL